MDQSCNLAKTFIGQWNNSVNVWFSLPTDSEQLLFFLPAVILYCWLLKQFLQLQDENEQKGLLLFFLPLGFWMLTATVSLVFFEEHQVAETARWMFTSSGIATLILVIKRITPTLWKVWQCIRLRYIKRRLRTLDRWRAEVAMATDS